MSQAPKVEGSHKKGVHLDRSMRLKPGPLLTGSVCPTGPTMSGFRQHIGPMLAANRSHLRVRNDCHTSSKRLSDARLPTLGVSNFYPLRVC